MKKLKCLLALTLMFGTLLTSLTSCATGDPSVEETNKTDDTEATSELMTDDPNYACDLSDELNFDTEVNFLYTQGYARNDELYSEKLGGGVIADAVYERNIAVEEYLGVTMAFSNKNHDTETASTIANLVQSGDESIDIFVIGTYQCMTPSTAGHYLSLNSVENINLSKHYWSQDFNEMMTFTDSNLQFVSTSPTAISLFRMGYLTIFNRDLFKDHQIPDLYEAVENGEWTLDYQYSLIKDVYVDSDGDSKKSKGDFYGFVVGAVTDMDVYSVASDIHMVVRNEDGELVYNSEVIDRLVEMGEKVSALCNTQGTYLVNSHSEGYNVPMERFADKGALMATVMFDSIETNFGLLADMNYGIAPIPKLNKEQKDYGTYIQDQVSTFGISASIGEEDRQAVLGAVLEAMSYYSYNIVRPAYYDSVLSTRFMQDPQSKNILDTMFDSISFDFVYATGLASIRDDMRAIISSSNPAIASNTKQWESKIQSGIRSQQRAFERLLEQMQ